MKYLLLINNDPNLVPKEGAELEAMMAGYTAFGQELAARGITFSGDPLQGPQTATTVRVRGGKTVNTDGPFAETKEWMAGFYHVDCKDLDEALELAAKIPGAKYGSVEVRPIASMCAGASKPEAKQAHAHA